MKRLWTLLALLVLLAGLVPAALAQGPTPDVEKPAQTPAPNASLGTNPNAGIESLTGSFVVFDSTVGGDTCFIPGSTQTFCFRAESYSPDWEYVYNLWQRFPTDWTVTNAYVQGTPYCDQGGTWGTFAWSFQTSPYEVNIAHARYQANNPAEHCVAYYCFEVTSGTGTPDALESWYWDGDGYGAAPHNPCSNDGYTPSGQNACDQATQPQAAIPPCTLDPIMLTPEEIDTVGCPFEPQEHTFTVWNNAGYDTNVDLTYTIVAGAGVCGGPAQVFVANGASLDIIVGFEPHGAPGDTVVCEIYAEDATTPANNDTSWIVKDLVDSIVYWEQIATMPGGRMDNAVGAYNGYVFDVTGYGVGTSVYRYDPATDTWTTLTPGGTVPPAPNYARSGCTAGNTVYTYGDSSTAGFTGLWGYNMDTNAWAQLTPSGTPPAQTGIWAPAWTHDPATGYCYMTGGATAAGGGNLTTVYVYDPAANAWLAPLPNFTTQRAFHAAFVMDGMVCVMGGVDAGSVVHSSTQCYNGASWNAENADIPAIPMGWWGMGYADKWHAGTDHQLWLINGADAAFALINNTYFYDVNTGVWVEGGALPSGVTYRTSATTLDNELYKVAGSTGGFTYSGLSDHHVQILCEPPGVFTAQKDAPAQADSGTVMTYDITIMAPMLAPGMYMSDTLPMGVEFAGNLTYSDGYAWYDDVDNAVYWTVPPLQAAAPAPARPTFYYPSEVADVVGGAAPSAPAPEGPVAVWEYPEAILWDNGPLVTHPGGGYNGADASVLQTALGLNTYGFGNQFANGYRMSDQFTITDPGGWQIDSVTFFAYQTGTYADPPVSTITGVYLQIWDGPPWAGGSIIWGDLVTNRLAGTSWPNMYRVLDTDMANRQRPPMANVATVGITLPPGTYWLDWMHNGSLASGPWAPPISIVGQTVTGDGYQYTTAWAPALDTALSTQQGLPFIVEGSIIGGGVVVDISFDVTVTAYCGETILNEGVAGDGVDVVYFDAETDVLGECEIEVTPEALFAELCPDATTELPLQICNVGTCDLVWELHEMTPTLALATTPAAPRIPYTGRPVVLSTASPEAVSVETDPPTVDAPVQLILDDGTRDNDIGLGGTIEILWVNRFTPAPGEFPFVLNEVQIYFSSVGLVNVGDDIVIIVYENTTGNNDPAVGANWLASFPTTVQALDTWSVYTLPTPIPFNGPGDVIIGAIGMEIPGTSYWPASIDQTASQQRSWAGWWNASPPPDPPILPPENWTLIDAYFPGNWMVRGYGETGGGIVYPDFPWISEAPISGTVAPGTCQTVTVTFDATGLTPGDYFADLLILSNDADEPEIIVPTTLTVQEAVEIVDVDYTITDLTVAFTPTVTGDEPIDYWWDFGDGGTSTETNPIYTYAAGGCYSVSLDVANACGLDSWVGEVCVVAPCDPVHDADFDWNPQMPLVGETVYFTATAAGDPVITYEWDLGDGTMMTGEFVNHAYAAADTYTVVMTASNDCGEQVVTYDVTVYGDCIPPYDLAFDWTPVTPTVGEVVTFNGSAEGTGPLTFAWDLGDGATGAGENPTHAYAAAGTYDVVMTVTNACGEEMIMHQVVVVEGCSPPSGAAFSWLPLNPGAGEVVAFTGSVVGGTPPITYAWDFGDMGTGAGSPINHTYAMSGTYTVVMTATNACGSDVATHDITVSGETPPPMYYVYLPLIFKIYP